ncbi:Heterokaryon incompatibility protein (HET) domain containing protein [Hyaloscypha variabilis]
MSFSKLLSRFSSSGRHGDSIDKQAFTPYTYLPLDEAAQEIRLLTLHRGKFKDHIKITLTNTPFTDDNVPTFEALSYTWGSPENPVDIFIGHVSGAEPDQTLPVTKNLGEALPYLRREDQDRVLWIDAISVNQQDLVERSKQVERMADIYSKATRVVAWLGPTSKKIPLALKCFDKINRNVEGDWKSSTLRTISGDPSWEDDEMPMGFKERDFSAIMEFCKSEWFERLWIYQEIILSSTESSLVYGRHSINWTSFRSAAYFVMRRSSFIPVTADLDSATRNKRLDAIANLCCCDARNTAMESLLECAKACKCSDPRDRIFALLSLYRITSRYQITPDYTKSTHEVYEDAFKRITAAKKNLKLLTTVEMHPSNALDPSWVPDWSHPNRPSRRLSLYSSGLSRAAPHFPSEKVMQVDGVVVDSIVLSEPWQIQKTTEIRPLVRELRRIVSGLFSINLAVDEPSLVSFCRTIFAGEFSETFDPPGQGILSLSQAVQQLKIILYKPDKEWPPLSSKFFTYIIAFSLRRCFCRTRKGSIILAPGVAAKGDVLTVLLGCSEPMILRPTREGNFKVVGGAYYDEIANGEALMGPIHDLFKLVRRWNAPEQSYLPAFLNTENNSYQLADPRLSKVSLPVGWRKKKHKMEDCIQLFINDITGEETEFDPRLTAESLRERGVDIQTLNLI